MPKAKFPKTLYVRREQDGDDHYFVADETTAGIVAADGEEEVGIYELVRRAKATAPIRLHDIKRR